MNNRTRAQLNKLLNVTYQLYQLYFIFGKIVNILTFLFHHEDLCTNIDIIIIVLYICNFDQSHILHFHCFNARCLVSLNINKLRVLIPCVCTRDNQSSIIRLITKNTVCLPSILLVLLILLSLVICLCRYIC